VVFVFTVVCVVAGQSHYGRSSDALSSAARLGFCRSGVRSLSFWVVSETLCLSVHRIYNDFRQIVSEWMIEKSPPLLASFPVVRAV